MSAPLESCLYNKLYNGACPVFFMENCRETFFNVFPGNSTDLRRDKLCFYMIEKKT
jgi:hypothetical protein